MTVADVIRRILREDCDFITLDTLRAYTGCSEAEYRAAAIEVMGAAWVARQDAARSL